MDARTLIQLCLSNRTVAWMGRNLPSAFGPSINSALHISLHPEPGARKWNRVVIFEMAQLLEARGMLTPSGAVILITVEGDPRALPMDSEEMSDSAGHLVSDDGYRFTCFPGETAVRDREADIVKRGTFRRFPPCPSRRELQSGRIRAGLKKFGWRRPKHLQRWLADIGEIDATLSTHRRFYQEQLDDNAADFPDVSLHYMEFGASHGLAPSPDFSSRAYLLHNPDVASSGMNPLLHYLRHGAREGRQGTRLLVSSADAPPVQSRSFQALWQRSLFEDFVEAHSPAASDGDQLDARGVSIIVPSGFGAKHAFATLHDKEAVEIIEIGKREAVDISNAISGARFEAVVVLGAEVEPLKDAIGNMATALHEGSAFVTGRLASPGGRILHAGGDIAPPGLVFPYRFHDVLSGPPAVARLCDFVCPTFFGVRKSVWQSLSDKIDLTTTEWPLTLAEAARKGNSITTYVPGAMATTRLGPSIFSNRLRAESRKRVPAPRPVQKPVTVVLDDLWMPNGNATNDARLSLLIDLRTIRFRPEAILLNRIPDLALVNFLGSRGISISGIVQKNEYAPRIVLAGVKNKSRAQPFLLGNRAIAIDDASLERAMAGVGPFDLLFPDKNISKGHDLLVWSNRGWEKSEAEFSDFLKNERSRFRDLVLAGPYARQLSKCGTDMAMTVVEVELPLESLVSGVAAICAVGGMPTTLLNIAEMLSIPVYHFEAKADRASKTNLSTRPHNPVERLASLGLSFVVEENEKSTYG